MRPRISQRKGHAQVVSGHTTTRGHHKRIASPYCRFTYGRPIENVVKYRSRQCGSICTSERCRTAGNSSPLCGDTWSRCNNGHRRRYCAKLSVPAGQKLKAIGNPDTPCMSTTDENACRANVVIR
jgi:hypothetical protein